jgi:excisionase family DNA binding protein
MSSMEAMLVEEYGPFMDIDELASLLKIKRQSMYLNIYHGRLDIPHAKLGKKYLFPTTQVASFLEDKINV